MGLVYFPTLSISGYFHAETVRLSFSSVLIAVTRRDRTSYTCGGGGGGGGGGGISCSFISPRDERAGLKADPPTDNDKSGTAELDKTALVE